MTPRERKENKALLDALSAQIFAQKHDGQKTDGSSSK
jgi:hypothetical protein